MSLSRSRRPLGAIAALVALACATSSGCARPPDEDDPWVPLIPPGRADFVVVFKPGVTLKEQAAYDKDKLQIERWWRRGVELPPGVRVAVHDRYDEDRWRIALYLWPDATEEQREALRRALPDSPVVDSVLEGVLLEDSPAEGGSR